MKRLLSFVCLLVLATISTQGANADIRPRTPEKVSKVVRRNLEIVPDEKVWTARLQLTQSDLKELRAAMDATDGQAGVAASIAHSPTRTIVAGMLLFLSVSFAGVWLARSASAGRARKAIVAGILVVAVIGAAAIITQGNAGPPPGYYSWMKLSKNFAQGRATSGDLVIEVVPDEPNRTPGVKLLIPYNPKQSGDEE
ncbi:MAG TPA: hypothetical protein VFY61_09790 [Pyrinomonadaceae bacterium]|nr:hypothetical protein [Pyrinomonadaceae bacterium]